MRFSTLLYTIKQGFTNIFRNKWYSLASIATISACLFLFGIFYSVVANFQYILKSAQDGVAVTVFFDKGISDERIAEIGNEIQRNHIHRRKNHQRSDKHIRNQRPPGFEHDITFSRSSRGRTHLPFRHG